MQKGRIADLNHSQWLKLRFVFFFFCRAGDVSTREMKAICLS